MSLVDLTLLALPFGLDNTIVVPEPVADDFLTSLRKRLKAVPALSTLAEVYLSTSPPSAEFPFAVINRLYQLPFLNTTDSYYKEVACQFTVYSRDDEEADALGSAAYDALFPRHENPPLFFSDGYEMTRTPGQSRGPESQAWGRVAGDPVWRYRFDYTFLVGK
jgi:hypothetical protein